MANSRYDYHKEEERLTDLRFNRDSYIIVRVDGDKFHRLCSEHDFHKPNDKRSLDLMIDSAKAVMQTYKGHIPLAYGHSDEFSFLIRSTSNLLHRRIYKITSMLPVIFATHFNNNWSKFFENPRQGEITPRKYDAWFDARPKEYANYRSVIDYFRWRQIDCHINNLYNTTLHCLTGRYIKHELVPIDDSEREKLDERDTFSVDSSGQKLCSLKRTPISNWLRDESKFFPSKVATDKLSGTVSAQKHDIMFLDYKVNYNNELEQFKKGTIVVDSQVDFDGDNADPCSIRHYHVDLIKVPDFWDNNKHIFSDYVACPSTK